MRTALVRKSLRDVVGDPFGFDRFFDSLSGGVFDRRDETAWAPAVDVQTTEKETVIRADLPGVDPKEIKVRYENGVLSIEGERTEKREKEDGRSHWIERFSGAFRRTISLPDHVDEDNVAAKYDNGVLEVTCPLKAEALPRQIAVSVN